MIVENVPTQIYYYIEDAETGKLSGDKYGKPFSSRGNAIRHLNYVRGTNGSRNYRTPYWPNARLAIFKIVRLENN